MSYKWPGIPNGDYSFDHGRAVWNKIINYLRRLSEKLDADIVDATADRRGMMTAADKDKLDGVEPGAEVNQNAFSGVKVGSSTIEADEKTDVLELSAGTGIELTADTTNDKVTIGGKEATPTAAGLMSAADKAILDAVPDTYVKKTGDTVTGNINSTYGVNGVETVSQFSGEMAGNDLWAIRTGITGNPDPLGASDSTTIDNGFLEIATADNGTEPIYISQYAGDHMLPDSQGIRFYQQVRRATLLDEQGNTVFPGTVTAVNFNGNATSANSATNANYATSAGTASKLGSSDVGSATQPIYLDDGVATACTYQLLKTVPADAVFTDTVYTHPTYTARIGKPTQDLTPAFGGTVTVSQVESDGTGHVTGMTDRTITIPATEASSSAAGLMSAADKSKLDGITAGAEPNQNAFSNIKVGSTTVAADGKTDTLELVAGSNITLTPDATNDTITIAATDTVYTHPTTSGNKHIPSGGSSGQILRWGADGTAVWGADNDVWSGYTLDINTNNTTDTWVPVFRNSTIQHRVIPADAKFTDTVYTHPTTTGNKHIPSGGSANMYLRWSSDGTAMWESLYTKDTGIIRQSFNGATTYPSVLSHYAASGGSGKPLSMLYAPKRMVSASDFSNRLTLLVYDPTVDNVFAELGIGYNQNGVFTIAPTPATSDNSTKIATTAYVRQIIPTGGSSGQILRWSAEGKATWGAADYYPKSGGALTGTDIYRSESNSRLFLCGGNGWQTGSRMWLNSKESGNGVQLDAMASDGSYKRLSLDPNGAFTWDGKDISKLLTNTQSSGTRTSAVASDSQSKYTIANNLVWLFIYCKLVAQVNTWSYTKVYTNLPVPASRNAAQLGCAPAQYDSNYGNPAYFEVRDNGEVWLVNRGTAIPANTDVWGFLCYPRGY